ncbi:RHS repeat-associated core domain-containing protein [Cysteiniphilum halobium]|uniref:RHS repeat-associated core domain-containing protein n=1 Tax=Cysteiniphilum halobium TaxID=2219059 RepID=UPI003F872EB3
MLKNKSKLYIGIGMSCLLITQSVAYSLNSAKAMDKQSKQNVNHQRVLVESAINYNANGSMSTDNKGASFSYNAANALTQVSLASGAKENDYYYANGLRAVAQNSTQVLVHYYSRNNELLNTSDGAQQSSAYLIANNVAVRSVMGDATVLLHNRHGSVITQLGDNPQFYQYSVYGVQKTEDGGQRTENRNGSLALAINPLRYSGYMFDPLTSLYYLKARDYDPSLRSFVQADSYAFNNQGLINGYFYGNNNPLMGVDPSGHVFEELIPVRNRRRLPPVNEGAIEMEEKGVSFDLKPVKAKGDRKEYYDIENKDYKIGELSYIAADNRVNIFNMYYKASNIKEMINLRLTNKYLCDIVDVYINRMTKSLFETFSKYASFARTMVEKSWKNSLLIMSRRTAVGGMMAGYGVDLDPDEKFNRQNIMIKFNGEQDRVSHYLNGLNEYEQKVVKEATEYANEKHPGLAHPSWHPS